MLPRVVLRFHSTATVVQRRARRPGWFTGAAAAAGVVGGTWLATSLYNSGGPDEETPQSAFSSFRQRLASLWGATDSQKQHQHGNQSLAASALASLKATAARWLAKKAEDPESREALLAFGSGGLLDFLVSTATEEVASPEQQHAEQAVVNFLGGYHTASRLLALPGAVPHLLHHIAAGRASPHLTLALQAVLQEHGADFSTGPSLDDARQTIQLLQGEPGSTVQALALQMLTAWAEAGQAQRVKLCSLGVAHALGQLAMQAVALGDSERELQGAVCRLQQLLLLDSTTVTDADLATWMQPLLYLAADAAAAAAAAAAVAASSSAGATSDGRGMLGSSAGAADLALADAAMTTLAAAVAAGGPLVKEALKGLPWLPTLDCLALSPDPAIRARAAAALAALATAGQLESQEAQIRWRDMLLGWLATSTAHLLAAPSSSRGSSSSDDVSRAAWLWSWFKEEGGAEDGTGAKGAVCQTTAANEALARSCVVALRALAQQEGPLGLSVAQLWLSRLLQQLSSRVAAYTSITQLAQTPVQAAAAAAGGLLPRVAKADAPLGAAAFSSAGSSSDATQSWSADAGAAGSSSSSWWWWGSSNNTSSKQGAGSSQGERASSASVAPELGAGTTLPPLVTPGTTSNSSSSWYWPFSTSGAPIEQQQQQQTNDTSIGGDAASEPHSSTATGSTHMQDSSSSTGPETLDNEALLESAKASIWRDAAPVTAASAKAAAEELRAAANAVLTAWLGAAGSLQLPSDLMPGMFAPAVVEAYPMAARVVDMSVAQQRTCTVLELLASVVAEDPSKQAWLLSAGILPVMERLALHADASLEPQAFVTKYSSSSSDSSSRGRSGGGDDSSNEGDAGSSSGLSLSARIGRSFWGWKNTRGSSSSAGAAATEITGSSTGAAAPTEPRVLQTDARRSRAADQNVPDANSSACHNSGSQEVDPVSAGSHEHGRQGEGQQPSSLLLLGLLNALDFDSSGSIASTDSHPAASAAVASVGSRLVEALQSKFTAAALASPRGSSPTADATAAAGGKEDAQGSAAAGFSHKQQQQQHASGSSSAATLMEFAQGAAGWEQGDLGGPVSRQKGPSNASLAGSTVPQALADNAAVITAAAEEGASWGDGDGLTQLRLQRQVARILSMLALQPAAAQQLTEAAQKLPGGAAELLQGLQQYAEVSKHLHDAPTVPGSTAAPKAVPGPSKAPLGSGSSSSSSSSSSGPSSALQDRRKQAVAAAAAAADAQAALAPTAAWLPWLLESAASDDCLLSSYATKALLHLESAVAYSGSRRRQQQQQQQTLLQQQPGSSSSSSSSTDSANRSAATWGQRLYQELRSSEELAQFMDGIWPFGSSSSDGSSWRHPVYYPDGIHLMHPADSHNWGMLQPPPVSLIDSLSAAAASAASAAAAAAASDLSQSDIQLPDVSAPTGGPESPSGASVATAALAVANAAAAAAAAAAASLLGADPSQLASSNSADGGGEGGGSGSSAASAAAGDVGVLQPAVSWLAHKLVKFAEIKEEEAQQALQEAAGAAQASPSNPAAPLSTFGALQALLGKGGSSGQVGPQAANKPAVTPQQHQQQGQGQQDEVVEEILQPPAPEVDIVFVHGIRGGPFVSWRKGHAPVQGAAEGDSAVVAAAMVGGTTGSSSSKRKGVALKPASAAAVHNRHMTQEECWPATWLATDVPNARLLTVEYKAPVTGWEGESLSLPDSGRLLLDKLLAAGIGQRPVVFVCHSMGGLIVKEMLSQSLEEPPSSRKGRLAAATCALAFYATPHFGSGMAALGWKLRHLPGASPAPSIHHLSPGPHLAALNARLAELHQTGRVSVLSLCEGLATNLAGLDFMPRILIVPFESAYPGFGEVHVLQDQDHITVCKPTSQEAPGYKLLLEFVRASVERAAAAEAAAAAQQPQVSADERAAAAAAEAAAASS